MDPYANARLLAPRLRNVVDVSQLTPEERNRATERMGLDWTEEDRDRAGRWSTKKSPALSSDVVAKIGRLKKQYPLDAIDIVRMALTDLARLPPDRLRASRIRYPVSFCPGDPSRRRRSRDGQPRTQFTCRITDKLRPTLEQLGLKLPELRQNLGAIIDLAVRAFGQLG